MKRFASAALALFFVIPACRSGADATVTERLWVSDLPKNPRAEFTAFVTTRVRDGLFVGSFYGGSLYRGTHQAIRWDAQGARKARVQTLQDERRHNLELKTCEPDKGFHMCVQVKGDRTFAGRYQSRRRWSVKRPGKKGEVLDIPQTLSALAADDERLAPLFEHEDARD